MKLGIASIFFLASSLLAYGQPVINKAGGLSGQGASPNWVISPNGQAQFRSITGTDISTALVSLPGGVGRSPAARAADELNLKDGGAAEDGTTDDTAALLSVIAIAQNRLNLGLPVGLWLPPGRTVISQALRLTVPANGHLSIRGVAQASEIATSFVGPAIQITTGNGAQTTGTLISLSGLGATKLGGTAAGGEAFEILGGSPIPQVKIRDLRCDSPYTAGVAYGGSAAPWHSCVHLQNIVRSDIDGVISPDGGAYTGDPAQGIGLWIDSSAGLYSIDNHVTHLQIVNGFAGVMVTGHVEGLVIDESTLLTNAYNVYAPGRTYPLKTTGPQYLLWASVSHSHMNSFLRGYYVVNGTSIKSNDNLYYNAGWSADGTPTNIILPPSTAWLPIDTSERDPGGSYSHAQFDCVNCGAPVVGGDEMAGNNAPYADAIRLPKIAFDSTVDVVGSGVVTGNILHNFQGAGVVVDPGITQTVVSSNHCDNVSPCVSTNEPTTLLIGNLQNGSVADVGMLNGATYLQGALWAAGGNVTATTDGTLTASGLVSKHNIQAGAASSVILTDSNGLGAGYLTAGTGGMLSIGTFTSGGQAGLSADYARFNKGLNGPGLLLADAAGDLTTANLTAASVTGTALTVGTPASPFLAVSAAGVLSGAGSNYTMTADGTWTASGLVSRHNVTAGPGMAFVTQDSNGNGNAYASAASDGTLNIGTFKASVDAGITTGAGNFSRRVVTGAYTTATLPAGCIAGSLAYASDGRKPSEAAGVGSGIEVVCTSLTRGASTSWVPMTLASAAVAN